MLVGVYLLSTPSKVFGCFLGPLVFLSSTENVGFLFVEIYLAMMELVGNSGEGNA